MSKSALVTKDFSTINASSINIVDKQYITQTGSITTSVGLDAPVGFITTVSTTIPTGGSTSFTFNNASIIAQSMLLINTQNYTGGTNGSLKLAVNNVTLGSAVITLSNSSTTSSVNGVATIGFHII